MKIRTIGRHFRQGLVNIFRNGWMTVASILSVTITLLILGVFLLLAMNVNYIADQLEGQIEIQAFVDLHTEEAELIEIENRIKNFAEVQDVYLIPSQEALDAFIDSMGEQGHYFESLKEENDFLPDTFVVHPVDPQDTERLARQIEQMEHVYKVNYGDGKIDKLFTVTNTTRNIGVLFIIGLAFTAMLLIANTIKTTIVARKREIEIMRLVGATNSFIRWPFFIEGMLLGLIGAIIPIVLLCIGYYQVFMKYGESLTINFLKLLPVYPLTYQMSLLLLGIGVFIGVWGSMMSVRRFLRI